MDSARRAAIRARCEHAPENGSVFIKRAVVLDLLAALDAADVRAEALIEKLARVRRFLIDAAAIAGMERVDGRYDSAYRRLSEAASDVLAKELATPDIDHAYYALLGEAAPAGEE